LKNTPDELRLRLTSDPAEIARARHAIESFAADEGYSESAVGEIGLVVNEALANVIRHAYATTTGRPIELFADVTPAGLSITIRDWGNGAIPDTNRVKSDPLTPGGLGIPCMRQMMDELKFIPQPDGMLLKMRRSKR